MYTISEAKLKSQLHKYGFQNIREFAEKNHLNRNTIHSYLRGKSIFSTQFLKIAKAAKIDPFALLNKRELPMPGRVPKPLHTVVMLLQDYNKNICVFLFGSRTGKNFTINSDWDLGLISAKGKLKTGDYLKLKNKVEVLTEDLTQQVDVVNFDSAPEWFFKNLIHRPIYLGGNILAWFRLLDRWEILHES